MSRIISGRSALNLIPAFRVGLGTNYNHTAANLIQFDTTSGGNHFNSGGYYSTSTYKFTAPVKGVYHFQTIVLWMSIPNNEDMTDSLRFIINSNLRSYSWERKRYVENYTGTSGYFADQIVDTFEMNPGDTIGVYGQETQTAHGNDEYTYFSGQLIDY